MMKQQNYTQKIASMLTMYQAYRAHLDLYNTNKCIIQNLPKTKKAKITPPTINAQKKVLVHSLLDSYIGRMASAGLDR